jgi:hypothetical protein
MGNEGCMTILIALVILVGAAFYANSLEGPTQ